MRYALRLSLPDRPGVLGAVATAMGRADMDITELDVVECDDGISVDDVWVETELDPWRVRAVCEAVAGVVVEALTLAPAPDALCSDAALAAAVAEGGGAAADVLVTGVPATLGATWAVVVVEGPGGLEVEARSAVAPPVPAGLRLPFLPLQHPRRFPQAQWMPPQWRPDAGDRIELAGVPLGGPVSSLLIARINGPRFRPVELQRLADLARVAVASSSASAVGAGV